MTMQILIRWCRSLTMRRRRVREALRTQRAILIRTIGYPVIQICSKGTKLYFSFSRHSIIQLIFLPSYSLKTTRSVATSTPTAVEKVIAPPAERRKSVQFTLNESSATVAENTTKQRLVVICAVIDSRTVYVRPSKGKQNDEYREILSMVAEQALNARPFIRSPDIKEMTLAPYQGRLCRAEVIAIDQMNCLVKFVDYGSENIVPITEMKEISTELQMLNIIPEQIILHNINIDPAKNAFGVDLLKSLGKAESEMIQSASPAPNEFNLNLQHTWLSVNQQVEVLTK